MAQSSKIKETCQRICNLWTSKESKPQCLTLVWIINRYIYYATEALIHGYVIKVYWLTGVRNAVMQLGWVPEPKRRMLKRHRRRFAYSSRVYGYMFYLEIVGKYIPDKYYQFFMDKSLKKRIEEVINTDAVYQFIK